MKKAQGSKAVQAARALGLILPRPVILNSQDLVERAAFE
jgi:hypothetical protein